MWLSCIANFNLSSLIRTVVNYQRMHEAINHALLYVRSQFELFKQSLYINVLIRDRKPSQIKLNALKFVKNHGFMECCGSARFLRKPVNLTENVTHVKSWIRLIPWDRRILIRPVAPQPSWAGPSTPFGPTPEISAGVDFYQTWLMTVHTPTPALPM